MSIKNIITAIAFIAIPVLTFAQDTKSNEQISKELGHTIDITNAEIKTLKAKIKADPTNTELITEKTKKEAELKKAKEQKKVIDTAIKAAKNSKKETEDAEKAAKKLQSTSSDADRVRNANAHMMGKSNDRISDELDNKMDVLKAEIKTLKTRKKAEPNNTSLMSEIASKEVELKEAKRHKKIFDAAIKAEKSSKKESKEAEKAQKKHEKAHKDAESMKSSM